MSQNLIITLNRFVLALCECSLCVSVVVTAISLLLRPQRKLLKYGSSAWWSHQFGSRMCEFHLFNFTLRGALIFNPRFGSSPCRHSSLGY